MLMLLAIVVVAYQLSVIHQMQSVNRNIADIDMNAATTALHLEKLADILREVCKKYLVMQDPGYEQQIAEYRNDIIEDLGKLDETARTEVAKTATAKLREALDNAMQVFNRIKQQNKTWDPDELPPDLTIALEHFQAQSEVTYEAVKGSIKEQVAGAAATGRKAEQISWIAGLVALLGVIVAGFLVQSINEPLRRLTHGTRAIAKGQFWHRLPAHGTDEFAEVARDFNSMSERLGELDKMKKDFVSHVSHDLKAPLASIRQIMHLLLQQIPGELNDQQKDLIRLSYNSAERLALMVGNLLDVSRMEAGAMEYRMAATDLVELIKSVSDEFDVQAREKKIHLGFECSETSMFAECSRERIAQVIGNLYENALKFSPPDTEIITRVGRGKGDEILISVSDSGPGVPDGHKERIFEKFHQVKHGKKIAGQGVGLGLAICKTIVQAHRGQIWVDNNPNGGSVFTFVLQPAASEEILKCGQSA